MKTNNPTASHTRSQFNKHELRRRFKQHPQKTIQWLIEHKSALPEQLRKKLERYLHKNDTLNSADVAAITEALAPDAGEEDTRDSEQETEGDVNTGDPAKDEEADPA